MFEHLSLLTKLAVGLAFVLFLPRVMQRFRLPAVLGFILAGVVLGPGLTGVLKSDSPNIELWANCCSCSLSASKSIWNSSIKLARRPPRLACLHLRFRLPERFCLAACWATTGRRVR